MGKLIAIPRHPVDAPVCASSKDFIEFYNMLPWKIKKQRSIEAAMKLETKRVVLNLLKFDHAPYMFHTANIMSFSVNKTFSVVSKWLEAVFSDYSQYSAFSVQSLKMDSLGNLYLDKVRRQNCYSKMLVEVNINYEFSLSNSFSNGAISVGASIVRKVKACDCIVSITGIRLRSSNVSNVNAVTYETNGGDITSWVNTALLAIEMTHNFVVIKSFKQ